MNDKKRMKALIVAGTIAAGVAFNSTDVKAAELNEVGGNINVADTVEQEEDSETKAGELSDAAKELEAEIANAQRDVISAEAAYKAADEEFNAYAAESSWYRRQYDRVIKKAEELGYGEDEYYKARVADEQDFIDRYNKICEMDHYWDTPEFEEIMAELYDRHNIYEIEYAYNSLQPDYAAWQVDDWKGYYDHYNWLKDKRDEAAQTLADAQKKLDDLNAKNDELVIPETPAEETVLSEDVYTVFNTAYAILIENPELLQKVYDYYHIEEVTEEDVFDYIVSKLDVETINYYAKELSSLEITPEVINTYMDMFFDWIAR